MSADRLITDRLTTDPRPVDQLARISALGDGTRLAIVELLATGARPVGKLAEALPVTRPAVSQHLKVLKDAGLVTAHREGTRHVYRLDPEGLDAVRAYFDRFWNLALAAFKLAAEHEPEHESAHEQEDRT